MTALLRGLDRALGRIEAGFAAVATVIMAAVMLIVTADVAMRYVFNHPLGWSYDLIDLYLSVFLFYLMLSFTFARHGQIRVDILQQYLGLRARTLCEVIVCFSAFAVFLGIAVVAALRCWSQFEGGDVVEGDVDWPSWLSTFAVPLGAGVLALRLLVTGLAQAMTLATGRVVIALPPLHAGQAPKPGVSVQ